MAQHREDLRLQRLASLMLYCMPVMAVVVSVAVVSYSSHCSQSCHKIQHQHQLQLQLRHQLRRFSFPTTLMPSRLSNCSLQRRRAASRVAAAHNGITGWPSIITELAVPSDDKPNKCTTNYWKLNDILCALPPQLDSVQRLRPEQRDTRKYSKLCICGKSWTSSLKKVK